MSGATERLVPLLIGVLSLLALACGAELTDRELRLDSRDLRVAFDNSSAQPYTVAFGGPGVGDTFVLRPFSSQQRLYEPDQGQPRAVGMPYWSLRLGPAVIGPAGEWLGTRGPTVHVAQASEPVLDSTAVVVVVIREAGVRWRLVGIEQ